MLRTRLIVVTVAALLIARMGIHTALAQQAQPPTAPTPANQAAPTTPAAPAEVAPPSIEDLSLENLKAKQAAAVSTEGLSESVRQNIKSLYDSAIEFRQQLDAINAASASFSELIRSAPQRITTIQQALNQPLRTADALNAAVTEQASQMTTAELEQEARRQEAELATARANLKQAEDVLALRREKPKQLRADIDDRKKRLTEIDRELKTPPPPEEPAPLREARRLLLQVRQQLRQAEITAFEKELAAHDIALSLRTAERDLAAREVARQEAAVKVWQAQAQERRQSEAMAARQDAERAQRQARTLPEPVRKLAEKNVELGKKLEELTADEADLAREIERAKTLRSDIEKDFSRIKQRVERAGLSEALGLYLRKQRQTLPNLRAYRKDSADRRARMSALAAEQIDIDERRNELSDIDERTDAVLASIEEPLTDSARATLEAEVHKLLSDQRDLLGKLQTGYNRYFNDLGTLDDEQQQLVDAAAQYAAFIDEHLLWIRSSKALSSADLKNTAEAAAWLAQPSGWIAVLRDCWESFLRSFEWWLLGLAAGIAMILTAPLARRDLARSAELVTRVQTDSFTLTLRALAMTAVLAVGWPLVLAVIGWQLAALPDAADFSRAVSGGLLGAAVVLATISAFSHVCRKSGLAHVHFRWPDAARRELRRNLIWLTAVLVPLTFIIAAVWSSDEPIYNQSLGRVAFIAAMIALAVFAARVLRREGGIAQTLLKRHPDGWLARLRLVWYPTAVGLPIVMSVLAALGYHYTALSLEHRVHKTVCLIILIVLANDLLLRWLFVAQRRLAFEEAKRKREALRAKQEAADKAADKPAGAEGDTPPLEVPEVGLSQINDQTRAVIRSLVQVAVLLGLWVVWDDVLPALNFLENIRFWPYTAVVDGVETTQYITLVDIFVALIVTVVTIVAARNLPGVLEITVLNRLPMEHGARYALTTICRYIITAVGLIVAFNLIGFSWSSVQWLVAALSVGLGFGLQEIVANFVSGLIILFERPFRVGDVVTIGGVSGTVSRIRIRATTIVDFDRRELIVPNKDFITGQLINWSLSDPITRIIVPVGIAYGSDTALAEKLLLKAGKENPLTLDVPEPTALFLGFGDNSLNFELRVFVNGIQNRLPITHQLHLAIDREFRRAGIEISFPQRDVHLDQAGPLEVRVISDQPKPSEAPVGESKESNA